MNAWAHGVASNAATLAAPLQRMYDAEQPLYENSINFFSLFYHSKNNGRGLSGQEAARAHHPVSAPRARGRLAVVLPGLHG
jgi:hypothetical protein